MEQKQRDFITHIQADSEIAWLTEAAQGYAEQTSPSYTESTFVRGNLSIQFLDRLLPTLSHSPNVLLVGLGKAMEPIVCTYEPFRIAAHLQGTGCDYRMTLVDVDQGVIDEVQNRTTLYMPSTLSKWTARAWQKYLIDTGQQAREIHEHEQGLVLASYLQNPESAFYYDILEKGVCAAEVSPQFRQKLQKGDISLLHSDIAVANIRPTGPYDYVEFTNVSYLMSPQGQQLAMANIAQSLTPEGLFLINDIGGYIGESLLSRFGGWLDDEKMAQLGLEVEEIVDREEYSETLLLKRKV